MDNPVKSLDPEQSVGDVAAAITMTAQISQNRSIVIQTYLPRDEKVGLFHGTLDKLGAAIDRQEAKYRLESLQAELAQHEKTAKALEEDYTGIEARAAAEWKRRGKKGESTLSDNERAQKSTAKTNIERYRVEITKIKAEIGKCEAVIAEVG